LKRAEPDVLEDLILMRGLRDFNIPKIVIDDQPIFKGLIEDLFPNVRADPQTDMDLNQ
jgi:dynein heavy chain